MIIRACHFPLVFYDIIVDIMACHQLFHNNNNNNNNNYIVPIFGV